MTCSGIFALGHVVRVIGIYHGWVRVYCLFLVAVSSRHVVMVWFNHQSPRPHPKFPTKHGRRNMVWLSRDIPLQSRMAIEILLFHYWLWMEESTFSVFAAFIQMWHWWNRQQTNPGLGGWISTCFGCWVLSPYVDVQNLLTLIHKSNCCACINIVWWLDPHVLILKSCFGS